MTDPTAPPLDPETPTEPRPELRATLTKIFSSRRKNIIAAAVVLVLIVGSTAGIIATNNAIDQHNAVIAAAQKSEMEAEAAAEAAAELVMATAADLKVQQEDFAAAKIEGQTSIDSVDPFIASVTAWASTAALTELVKLRSDLTETIVTADVTEAQSIRDGAAKITAAIDAIPTLEEHQDEVYIAAEAAAGEPRTDTTYAIRTARDYCTALLRDYPDVNSFVDKFAGEEMITDYRRAAAYCPAYLSAMDKVGTQIPGDGGYSVAATGTGYGSNPRVLAAGTYGTLGTPSDCYWEVNDSHGNILRNNFIMAAPGGVTIRVAAGQGFTTQGCGWWERR